MVPITWWITPTLLIGRVPDGIARAVSVDGPQAALEAIEAGKTAVLPVDAWDDAEKVLGRLGMSPEEITDKIAFARTGEVPS